MGTKQKRKWLNLGLAIVIGGGTIYGLSNGVGPLPALASAFHPAKGVWTSATQNQLLPTSQDLVLPSVEQNVQIAFEPNGTPHIKAESNRDAWYAVGYLHAKFRLFQMDMMRRQGAGLLAEVVGASALESDQFQREVNLTRTAEAEWAQLKPEDEVYQVLEAYTEGINTVIDEQTKSGKLPMMFKIMGYEPSPWKPQDTLLLKGVLAQMMSLNTLSATYQLFVDSFGEERAMQLVPILPTNQQSPYDRGPYQKHPLRTIPISAEQYFASKEQQGQMAALEPEQNGGGVVATAQDLAKEATTAAVLSIAERLEHLHKYAIQENSNSNAWVVSGSKTASGQALLAGDPHLELTMPSIWYQYAVDAPDYHFSGVSVPGIPFALVGQNEEIAWTLTNGQNQQTFFYKEQTDESHPNQYFYKGEWRDMSVTTHEIPVKGGGTVPYEIKSTVHGPIVSRRGQTLAMAWTGVIPSRGVESLMNVMKAKNYDDFTGALQHWSAPIMNFTYADRAGNIGVIGAGTYAVFGEQTKPWLPMSGTGEDDIIGAIPFEDIPQSYNPPSGFIGTGNQRQTTADYPYYIGPAILFDNGARANRMYEELSKPGKVTAQDMAKMQADVTDTVAAKIVPKLLQALSGASLNEREQEAMTALSGWNHRMEADSVGAGVWWTFWDHYIKATYGPWWEKYQVPYEEHDSLVLRPYHATLSQNLEKWTLDEPTHAFFSNPVTAEKRDANAVMVQAFHAAAAELEEKRGDQVAKWTWQSIHTREIPSITQIPALGYAPKGAEGGAFTLNVAIDMNSTLGPSWRMITDWETGKSIGSYPGGQSENPVSPWYQDRVETWWNNQYAPMVDFEQAIAEPSSVLWKLVPQK